MNANTQSLQTILGEYLRERGLHNVANRVRVPEVWLEVIGENAAKHCHDIEFTAPTLSVRVDSPVWRSELRLRKHDLVRRINERLEPGLVADIILR
jgi:predicted nucleic acid-binding Zn ribbon protein